MLSAGRRLVYLRPARSVAAELLFFVCLAGYLKNEPIGAY